jgi:molybdenum cofactor biosynthesis protein MoaC
VRATVARATLDSGLVQLALDPDTATGVRLAWTGAPGHEFAAPGLFRYLYVKGRDPGGAEASRGGRLTLEDAGPLVVTARIDGPAGGVRASSHRFRVVAGSPLVFADVELEIDADEGLVRIEAEARVVGRTGVEMEAMAASMVAALTVYDMVKGLERGVTIESVQLLEKSGGRSGHWRRDDAG